MLCTEMCWKTWARGPALDAVPCPRSTKLLLPPALRIRSFPFPWPRDVTFLGFGIIYIKFFLDKRHHQS